MQKIKSITILILLLILITCFWGVYAYNLPKWFPFNADNALKEWQEKVFRNKVLYVIEAGKEGGYLSAKSDKACSGLLHRIKYNAKTLPMMSWSWKVSKFPQKGRKKTNQEGWLERDDYAARVYVIFPGWALFNIKCIEYIWDDHLPEGSVFTSPYSRNIKLFVVESGRKNLNK